MRYTPLIMSLVTVAFLLCVLTSPTSAHIFGFDPLTLDQINNNSDNKNGTNTHLHRYPDLNLSYLFDSLDETHDPISLPQLTKTTPMMTNTPQSITIPSTEMSPQQLDNDDDDGGNGGNGGTSPPTSAPPLFGDPIGFIPLRHEPNINEYLVDIALGGDDSNTEATLVKSLVLDTTGEFLIIFTPEACRAMKPPIDGCAQPRNIFTTTRVTPNFGIDQIGFYCDECFVASDTVYLLWSRDGTSLTYTSHRVDMVAVRTLIINGTETSPKLYNYGPFRGLFGLGPPYSRQRPLTSAYVSPFPDLIEMLAYQRQTLPQNQNHTTTYNYGLDLYPSFNNVNATSQSIGSSQFVKDTQRLVQTQSRLYLNGIPPQYNSSIQWQLHPSAPRSSIVEGTQYTAPYPLLTAYHVKYCDLLIYNEYSVIIDTMSPCLGVPSALFDSLMSWLPMECDYTLSDDGNRQCYYTPPSTAELSKMSKLPTMQFFMQKPTLTKDNELDPNATQPPALYIPFEQLLFPAQFIQQDMPLNVTAHAQRMCITTSSDRFYINLGNVPLSSFYLHRDFDSGFIGLANKAAFAPSNDQCLPRLQCIGQESSYPVYNYCFPPACNLYWFFSYDHPTRSCILSPGYFVIIAVIFLAWLIMEGWFFLSEDRLDKRIHSKTPRMTLVTRSSRRRMAEQGSAPPAQAGDTTNETRQQQQQQRETRRRQRRSEQQQQQTQPNASAPTVIPPTQPRTSAHRQSTRQSGQQQRTSAHRQSTRQSGQQRTSARQSGQHRSSGQQRQPRQHSSGPNNRTTTTNQSP